MSVTSPCICHLLLVGHGKRVLGRYEARISNSEGVEGQGQGLRELVEGVMSLYPQ